MIEDYEYLDLLSRKLDPVQKTACCRTENTIVAAGAGSGKTQVLATRFAWLVMSCRIPASQILTLTFTNKAAAEMYSRIYSTLKFFADNSSTPPDQRQMAEKAIEQFNDVHIQTLDSYCSGLVRQAASRYGIPPDFVIDSADVGRKIGSMALAFILKNRDNKAVQFYANPGKLEDFADKFFASPVMKFVSVVQGKNSFVQKLLPQCEKIKTDWNRFVACVQDEVVWLEQAMMESGRTDGALKKVKDIWDCKPAFVTITDKDEIENAGAELAEKADILLNWLSRLAKCKKSQKPNEYETETNDVLANIAGFVETGRKIAFYISEYEYIKEYVTLFDTFAAKVVNFKRTSGSLSFKDVADLALKILIEQKDLRVQEKNSYSKIMIDEFQDNNGQNRDLLFLLSEKNSVFTDFSSVEIEPDTVSKMLKNCLESDKLYFVGDEKQSIYKFRGADVAVFNELKTDLDVEPVKMTFNYRSSPELLSSFNKIFGDVNYDGQQGYNGIFRKESVYNYEAAFAVSDAARKLDIKTHEELPPVALDESNVKVHVCMVDEKQLESDKDRLLSKEDQQAMFIAKKIKELYESMPEGERKYGDIAILDKNRNNRRKIQTWLSRYGIPYEVDSQSGIFSEAIVNDIYVFLRLCVYPSDTKAFAAFLTSGFVKLSVSALETVLSCLLDIEDKNFVFVPFDEQKEQKLETVLAPEDFQKYKVAEKLYKNNRRRILSSPVTKTLTMLWFDTGYRYETMFDRNLNLFAEHYDLLFETARKTDEDGKGIAWFIDQLQIIKKNEDYIFASENVDLDIKEILYPLEKPDAVKIMTIHKSKGLQFKHVFVYGCTQQRSAKADSSKIFFDPVYGLSVCSDGCKSNYFYSLQSNTEQEKDDAEYRRVFYVALTRAEKSAFITGSWKEAKSCVEKLILQYYPEVFVPAKIEQGQCIYADGAPFSFTSVELNKKDILAEFRTKKTPFDADSVKQVYDTAQIVDYPEPESIKITPSLLEKNIAAFGPVPEDVPFAVINDIISRHSNVPEYKSEEQNHDDELFAESLSSADFSYSDFGTLAHDYLEKAAVGVDTNTYVPAARLFKNLSDDEKGIICQTCVTMAEKFFASPLGIKYLEAKSNNLFYKSEYGFKHWFEGKIITGFIDLCFENKDGTYTIVDYKSDSVINPERYYEQQRCYLYALSELLSIGTEKIRCFLYYLRYDKTIEITDNLK